MCMHATNIDHNHLRTFPFQKYKCMTISEQMWKPCMVRERFKHFVNQDDAQHQAMHDAEMWIVDCFHIFFLWGKTDRIMHMVEREKLPAGSDEQKIFCFFQGKKEIFGGEWNRIAQGERYTVSISIWQAGRVLGRERNRDHEIWGQRGIPRNMYCSI